MKTIKTTKTIETTETIETVDAAAVSKPTKESSYQRSIRAIVKRALLDPEFRKEFTSNPAEAYAKETGKPLPGGFQLRVVEDAINVRHVILPHVEAEIEQLSDDEIDAIASGAAVARMCGF